MTRRNDPSDKYVDNSFYANALKKDLLLHPQKYAGFPLPIGATRVQKKRRKVVKKDS